MAFLSDEQMNRLTQAATGAAAGYIGGEGYGALAGAATGLMSNGDTAQTLLYGAAGGAAIGMASGEGFGGTIGSWIKGLFTAKGTTGALEGATTGATSGQGFLASVSGFLNKAFGGGSASKVPVTGTAAANGAPEAQASMAGEMDPETKKLLILGVAAAVIFMLFKKGGL